jgi:hypothetical protein
VLAQKLFIEKAGLPSPVINQLKRLAAFQNPEFYKKQSMRLPTAMTPRIITCAEDLPQHVGLPRGCRPQAEDLFRQHGAALAVQDQRHPGVPVAFHFHGQLTPVQQRAAAAMLAHDIGVFVAPPGVGKTVLGTHLIAARGVGHKRIDETMLYVHFAEGHLRPLPAEVLAAGRGVEDPDGKIVAMLGTREGVRGKKLARPLGPVKESAGASAS